MERLRDHYTVQAWLVLLLAGCFGISLAGVHLSLSPRIAANKINETRRMVPELVLGPEGMNKRVGEKRQLDIESTLMQVKRQNRMVFYPVFRAMENMKTAGWVVKSSGQGYADKIELLIGFDTDMSSITGLFVLEQKETPGLGNKIADGKWRAQFMGKGTDRPLRVVKTGASAAHEIDVITGATISSKSVCSIVNRVVKDLKEPLSAGDLKITAKGQKENK